MSPEVAAPPDGKPGHGVRVIIKPNHVRAGCERIRVRLGEWIRWQPEEAAMRFHIDFQKGMSPFDQEHLGHPSPQGWQKTVREGTFKYSVTDYDNPKNYQDPVVVVDPPTP